MKPDSLPDKISYADFNHCLDDYPQQVQENLQALQQLRYHDIPEAIARRAEAGKALLEKTQLQSLVEWKLYVDIVLPYQPSSESCLPMPVQYSPPSPRQETRHLPPHPRRPHRFQPSFRNHPHHILGLLRLLLDYPSQP